MKKSFKKIMSIALVVMMLVTMFSISASAATYVVTLKGGTRTLNGVKCTSRLNDTLLNLSGNEYTDANGTVYIINKEEHTVQFETDSSGYVTFPEMFFVMDGHTQSAWGTSSTSNGSTTYKEGRRLKITGAKTYYPRFDTIKYSAEFLPGADGVGTPQQVSNKTYGSTVTLPDAIFTRAGYVQIGWSHTENATEVDYALSDDSFKIQSDVKFYPVWNKVELGVSYDASNIAFGSICVDYEVPAAKTFTIINEGNANIKLTLPTSSAYDITTADSTTLGADGGKAVISIQPKGGLPAGIYSETLAFSFDFAELDFVVTAKFMVNNHLYITYTYNDDATYEANGTETAYCFNDRGTEKCNHPFTREAEGTQKNYSADNNVADGLLPEYLYHKTVNFVAFGSGMDNTGTVVTKRFRPTEWSVNDGVHSGKFAEKCDVYNKEDYTVKYDHKDFGQFELTIKYVEEEKQNGEWVKTGIEDTKTFKYSIGPSAEDEKEIVMPNIIVKIVFGLFTYLIDMLATGNLPF